MNNTREGMKVARTAAWSVFGARYWRWFVFGPIAAKVLGTLIVLAGFSMAGLFVAENVSGWLEWLDWFFSRYMLPSIFVAVGVSIYAIGAVLAWRTWGWLLRVKGLNTSGYAAITSSFLILFVFVVGVTL